MSEYTPPPPPPPYAPPTEPPAPEKKKGLPPLAWVGIGCGALLVVALIVFVAGSMFVAKKVRDDPAMALATTMVRLHPELELVESDQEAGTLTVRNKETGEEMTFNLEEVEQGRLSMLTGEGEESSITFGQGEGGLEITTEEGGKTSSLRFGAGSDEVPDWVPVYPGSQPAGTYLATTAEGTSGLFSVTTSDPPEEVLDWYAGELEELGLTVERTTFATPVNRGGTLAGRREGRELTVTVVSQDEGTQAQVMFNDK
jgi:hypothetical protein